MQTVIWYGFARTPVGELLLVGDDEGLLRVEFEARDRHVPENAVHDEQRASAARKQLDEYFAGQRREFDLPLVPRGTAFQLAVWGALRQIPYGATRTYADLAATIGRPSAVRAVGAANGANPLPIVIPCHRVIGSNGSLTGFGGGIDVKRRLLDFEAGLRRLL